MNSNIFKGGFFSEHYVSTVGLKMFCKLYWKQMCCHPSSIVLFLEHRQSRFNIILKGPGVCGMVNEHWLPLKVTTALASNERVCLSFEA